MTTSSHRYCLSESVCMRVCVCVSEVAKWLNGTWRSDRKSAPVNSLRVCVVSTHFGLLPNGSTPQVFLTVIILIPTTQAVCACESVSTVHVKVCVCVFATHGVYWHAPLIPADHQGREEPPVCPETSTHTHKHALYPTLPYPYLLMVSAFHHGLLNGIGDTHTQASVRSENTLSYFSFWPKITFINAIKAP